MSFFPANDEKFDEVRALKLPLGRYAITSSGPLGIRDIREIGDIDLIVDDGLWELLAVRFGIITEFGIVKVKIGKNIDVFYSGSFTDIAIAGAPSLEEQIASADAINGLSFVSLEHILYFKEHMNRSKDATDIAIIKRLLGRL